MSKTKWLEKIENLKDHVIDLGRAVYSNKEYLIALVPGPGEYCTLKPLKMSRKLKAIAGVTLTGVRTAGITLTIMTGKPCVYVYPTVLEELSLLKEKSKEYFSSNFV